MTNLNNLIGLVDLPLKILENSNSSIISFFIKDGAGKIYLITEKKVPHDFSRFSSFYNMSNNDFFQIISQLIEFSEQGQTSSIAFKESILKNGKILNPQDSLNLSCSQNKVLNEFSNISLMICDKIFKKFERSPKITMLDLCTDQNLKDQFSDVLNRPPNDPREEKIKANYPTFSQYHPEPDWMTTMLIRDIYEDKDFDSRRILSFLKDGDAISNKIETHVNQAVAGDIQSAVKGLAEVMVPVREFTENGFRKFNFKFR